MRRLRSPFLQRFARELAALFSAALQEDVDIIGLSILSGAHIPLVTAVQALLKKQNIDKPIFVGGIIPGDDAALLLAKEVAAVFGPGSSIQEIAIRVKEIAAGNSGSYSFRVVSI